MESSKKHNLTIVNKKWNKFILEYYMFWNYLDKVTNNRIFPIYKANWGARPGYSEQPPKSYK